MDFEDPARSLLAIAIVSAVFAFALPARADLTLVLGHPDGGGPSHQVHVKEGRVAVVNAFDKRVLVFDGADNSAVVVDHARKEVTGLSREALEKLVVSMVETRRQYLADLEKRLDELPKDEREKLRGVMDFLHLTTEPRGSVMPAQLRFEGTGDLVDRFGEPAERARVFREEQPWGTALLGDWAKYGISESDHAALMSVQAFFDEISRGMPSELRAQFGQVGLVAPDGRLLLEIRQDERLIEKNGEGEGAAEGEEPFRLEVMAMDGKPVESGWFEVPEDFTRMSLFAVPKPGSPAGAEADGILEK